MIKGKRILITGISGSIGSELARQLCKDNFVIGLDSNESGFFDIQQETSCHGRVGDIRDEKTVFDVFSDFKPQIVFHAAAYKHVPLMEKYPIEAITTNINGTWNVLNQAKRWECLEKFVFISTDKAVSSNSIMGASKRMCEIMVKNQGKGFVSVRFGNVIGSRGSLYTIWERQLKEGKPMTVTDERMTRYMMSISEACELVIRASEEDNGILVLDMGEPKKIIELAVKFQEDHNIFPYGIKYIGSRPGEVLHEELMYDEEKKVRVKKDKYYLIK